MNWDHHHHLHDASTLEFVVVSYSLDVRVLLSNFPPSLSLISFILFYSLTDSFWNERRGRMEREENCSGIKRINPVVEAEGIEWDKKKKKGAEQDSREESKKEKKGNERCMILLRVFFLPTDTNANEDKVRFNERRVESSFISSIVLMFMTREKGSYKRELPQPKSLLKAK